MRISFDLDGVLADMDAALARIAEQEFGVTVRSVSADPRRGGGGDDEKGRAEEAAGDSDGRVAAPAYDTALLNSLTTRQQ